MQMDRGDHACVIYTTRDELVRVAAAYLEDGFTAGEQCWYVASTADEADDVRVALGGLGIDVALAERRQALRLVMAQDFYLASGTFDPEQMLQRFSDVIAAAENENFTGFRLAAEMSWALDSRASLDEVIEYEALVGSLFSTSRASAVCFYQADRMPPQVLDGALTTHPLVGVGGPPKRNPFHRPGPVADLPAFRPDDVAWKLKRLQGRSR
jgi:two-component system, chemotaxis family, sensor kinase Cph1